MARCVGRVTMDRSEVPGHTQGSSVEYAFFSSRNPTRPDSQANCHKKTKYARLLARISLTQKFNNICLVAKVFTDDV